MLLFRTFRSPRDSIIGPSLASQMPDLTKSASKSKSKASKSNNNSDLENPNDPDLYEARRATALLLMYQAIDENDHIILAQILSFKSKIRNELLLYLELHYLLIQYNNDNITPDPTIILQFKRAMMKFIQLLPTNDKKIVLLEKLHLMKDKTIFRLIQQLIFIADNNTSTQFSKCEDIKQRVDSKSALGEYIHLILDFACFNIINENTINYMLKYIISIMNNVVKIDQNNSSNQIKTTVKSDEKMQNVHHIGQLLLLSAKHARMVCLQINIYLFF